MPSQEDVGYWRDRARESRTQAADAESDSRRNTLEELAAFFDMMASISARSPD